LVDNLLNIVVLFRAGRASSSVQMLTDLIGTMFGVGAMIAYERVLRTKYVDDEMRLRAQEQLASYLFHELRNHQNVQSGTLDIVGEHTIVTPHSPLSAEDVKLVAETRVHAWHAGQIIANMLDFTKLRAGKLKVASERFELVGFLDECVLLVQHMARAKEGAVSLDALVEFGRQPRWLLGPGHLLKQVVVNLLTNALKYTAAGRVRLRATLSGPDHAQWPPVVIRIEDTGCGIPEDKLSAIFQPFEHGYKPGTGLGLPLCKDILDTIGSRLTVSHRPLGGSVFFFALNCPAAPASELAPATALTPPKALAATAPPRATTAVDASPAGASSDAVDAAHPVDTVPAALGAPGGSAVRVLVADDLRMNRLLLIRQLRQIAPHARIDEVADGEGALAALLEAQQTTAPFDIAFLDEFFSADGLLGTEVTHRFREAEVKLALDNSGDGGTSLTRRLLIIGCTGGLGDTAYDERAHAAGQDHVLGKPMPTTDRLAKLLHVMRPGLLPVS
jgi:signal transduction histidine kinase/CheY-like chemotaxis protein